MIKEMEVLTVKDFEFKKPGWCPGCGDFGLFRALLNSFVELGLRREEIVVVGGIGCSGKITDYVNTNSIHTLHGRVLPVALGIKLVNPKLKVIGVSGDGDSFAIGIAHFIHTARRNPDLTLIVMDNQVYGLTKGQVSPTSDLGFVTPSTPYGSKEEPIITVDFALVSGATFVARGFSGEVKELTEIIKEAILHRGFSYVDVLSPCVTFNKKNTYEWYRSVIRKSDWDPRKIKRQEALLRITEEERDGSILTGIFFVEEKPTFEDLILPDKEQPIAYQDITPRDEYLEILEVYK